MASRRLASGAVLLVGLGRYGAAAAEELVRLGREVLAVERDPVLVQSWAGRITQVVEADATDLDALRQVGAGDFERAIVAIGDSIESSVLVASNLVDLGIPQLWAKAITPAHGHILGRIGVHHVVYPERDAGERTAHLMSGRLLDYIEFDDGFAMVKMRPPRETVGRTLTDSDIRRRYGVTVVGIKPPDADFEYAVPATVVSDGDILVVSGQVDRVERFAARP